MHYPGLGHRGSRREVEALGWCSEEKVKKVLRGGEGSDGRGRVIRVQILGPKVIYGMSNEPLLGHHLIRRALVPSRSRLA
jgi:hypothetical protein